MNNTWFIRIHQYEAMVRTRDTGIHRNRESRDSVSSSEGFNLRNTSGHPYHRTTQEKYKMISKLLAWFSMLLTVIMLFHSWSDYQDYIQMPVNSAPFSVNLLVKGLTYGTTIVIALILARVCARKAEGR